MGVPPAQSLSCKQASGRGREGSPSPLRLYLHAHSHALTHTLVNAQIQAHRCLYGGTHRLTQARRLTLTPAMPMVAHLRGAHTLTYRCTFYCACTHVHTHPHTPTHIHTMLTLTHARALSHLHGHTHVHTRRTHTCLHTRTCSHICIYSSTNFCTHSWSHPCSHWHTAAFTRARTVTHL